MVDVTFWARGFKAGFSNLFCEEDGMKKAVLLLRIASVLALVHGVLHTIGGVFGSVAPGAMQTAATAMQTNRFEAMGANRSYWDFIMGYGLITTVKFLVETVVFWQLASLLKAYGLQVRPLLIAFCVGYVADAFIAWRYFFAGPAVFEIVIAGCLFWAWWLAGRTAQRVV
jgi:hypothetical protein